MQNNFLIIHILLLRGKASIDFWPKMLYCFVNHLVP